MKVEASGVCHTDLHAARGDWPVKPQPPFIPGHEGVGFAVAVGRNVKGVREGDRIGVPWLHTACGHCSYCRTGWETLCHEQQNTGYSVDGGFAEYVLADPDYVGHLPDTLEFGPAAPVLCAGVTVYKGIKEAEVKPGEWIAISGIGGLGHMAVQYAKAMGLHVAAVDIHPEKLALAAQLGADLTVLHQLSLPTHEGIIVILIVGLALLLRTCTPMDPARQSADGRTAFGALPAAGDCTNERAAGGAANCTATSRGFRLGPVAGICATVRGSRSVSLCRCGSGVHAHNNYEQSRYESSHPGLLRPLTALATT
jgi:D-arabinose 1-dehydrogenase-like Zn-dependent alcohol dehydrogenase